MNWIKRLLGLKTEEQCAIHSVMPSLHSEIVIDYKTDLDNADWNMTVVVNGKNVGRLERGSTYGYWFISTIGQDIHAGSIDKLKSKVFREFENYRMFFSNEA